MNCDLEVCIPLDIANGMLLGDMLWRAGLNVEAMLGIFPTGPPFSLNNPLSSKTYLLLRRYPARLVTA
ncbi:MAG TPA: hypothetical protein VFA19_15900 [Gaiellaceae bacterium]|nr:hypothetical protein [Gaiellaceae bacterium]